MHLTLLDAGFFCICCAAALQWLPTLDQPQEAAKCHLNRALALIKMAAAAATAAEAAMIVADQTATPPAVSAGAAGVREAGAPPSPPAGAEMTVMQAAAAVTEAGASPTEAKAAGSTAARRAAVAALEGTAEACMFSCSRSEAWQQSLLLQQQQCGEAAEGDCTAALQLVTWDKSLTLKVGSRQDMILI